MTKKILDLGISVGPDGTTAEVYRISDVELVLNILSDDCDSIFARAMTVEEWQFVEGQIASDICQTGMYGDANAVHALIRFAVAGNIQATDEDMSHAKALIEAGESQSYDMSDILGIASGLDATVDKVNRFLDAVNADGDLEDYSASDIVPFEVSFDVNMTPNLELGYGSGWHVQTFTKKAILSPGIAEEVSKMIEDFRDLEVENRREAQVRSL